MKNIAIIPARSGSKGLKDKNIKLLNGKPLLAYSIEASIKSKCFDTVMVSTDSKKYADIAKKYGAEVPFLRSKKNSSDKSSSWDVVKEVLNAYKENGKEFDNFMLLQPTSPLRTQKDIKNAFKLQKENNANSIVSVCEEEHSPEESIKLKNNLYLSPIIKNRNNNRRRQDMDKYYRMNGSIYLCKTSYFNKYGEIYNKGCYAYKMNNINSVDIDTELDFVLAEYLLKKQ